MPCEVIVYAPVKGRVLPLEEVADEAFAERMVGEGIGLRPLDSFIYPPIEGYLKHLFQNHHAFSIITNKVEILVHVGVESLKTKGMGFALINPQLQEKDFLLRSQAILKIDLDFLESNLPSLDTPVVVTNYSEIENFQVLVSYGEIVKVGEAIFRFTL